MSKISDLEQEKTQKLERMEVIGNEAIERKFTDAEIQEIETLKKEVEVLEKEIIARQSIPIEINKKQVEKPKMEEKRKTSLELVRELANKGQTEDILKRNSELGENIATQGVMIERNYSHGTNGTDISPVGVDGLNLLEGIPDLWMKMGVTTYTNLKGGTQKLPFMDAFAGQLVAEKGTITRTQQATNHVELSPQRFGEQIEVTREGLATFNQSTWDGIMRNVNKAIDRKITAYIYEQILAGATEVAGGAITKPGFDALEAAVPVDGVYFMARPTFYEAKAVAVDAGSGIFLANKVAQDLGETYEGTPIFHSGLFADGAGEQYVTYGVGSNIAVGMWGSDAYEVIVDPFTKAALGTLVITISKICDVKIPNAAVAFVKTADLNPA